MNSRDTAAFFRVEGIVLSRGVLAASAYIAANAKRFRERALRLGLVALAAPVHGILGQTDRALAHRLVHLAFRGMSEDRVSVLAEEYAEDILKDKLLDQGLELMKRAQAEGHKVVLLSDGIAPIMQPLARHLKHYDDLVCNHLEFRDGEATGKLLEPIVGGASGGVWLRRYATEHGLDLARCAAYGSHGPDMLLLSAVGRPCAVNPDFVLRRSARDADWPVVEYRD
ncbi:MAG: HAD-IB family phosphatase [Myxococcales bacterium]|jgi:HAD superfamily phosphoserine phosphatase-like hydrolase|nr:HAD-IB family phosphatase [Myxococcales bacterium]